MNKALILLMSLILVSAAHAETKIYKHVDEDGNIYYSDKKPTEDAKEAELPGLTIVESKNYKPKPAKATTSKPKNENPALYADFAISSPQQEQTIHNTGGVLNVSVHLNGPLPKSHAIRFFVDGEAHPLVNSTQISIPNVFRGEHVVHAQAIDLRQNKVIKTSPKVTFFMRQHVKKR